MSVKIDESWKRLLESEFNSEYFKKLISFVKEEYSVFKCYPKGSEIFNAFDSCPIDKLKNNVKIKIDCILFIFVLSYYLTKK